MNSSTKTVSRSPSIVMDLSSIMNPEQPPKSSTLSPVRPTPSPQQRQTSASGLPSVPHITTSSSSIRPPFRRESQTTLDSPSVASTVSPWRPSLDSPTILSPSAPSPIKRLPQQTKPAAKRTHSVSVDEAVGAAAHRKKRIKRMPTPKFAQLCDPTYKPPVRLWEPLPKTQRNVAPRSAVQPRVDNHIDVRASEPRPLANGVSTTPNSPAPTREPSILNVIPHEDITREVSNFLFKEVVMREEMAGVAIEVEAKMGQIMDKNTNDRIRLPAITETVLSQSDPNLRIGFRSSVTLAQHKSLNDTLNEATRRSMMPNRHKVAYKHRHETDAFYDLSQSAFLGLPSAIRNNINSRHNPSLRVTTDQKTGELLAKIVKVRLCDLHVYSPQTLYDYRISINLEMDYQGDHMGFEPSEEKGRSKDRNKDRLSYTHQEYQIDLTQVTPPGSTAVEDKEHELEVEISTQALREQGDLARRGQPTYYEDLVRGFLDNVRLLTRTVKI